MLLLLDRNDRIKDVGLRFEAYDFAALSRITVAVASSRKRNDWREAIAAIRDSAPPALDAAEREYVERGLAQSVLEQVYQFELERAGFLARVKDPAELAGWFHLLALRERLDLSRESVEAIIWLLEPRLRGDATWLEGLPGADSCTRTPEEELAILTSSEPLHLLYGTDRLIIDGEEPLAAKSGATHHGGGNIVRPESLREIQRRFDDAIPKDLSALLPDWRRTWMFSIHSIRERLIFAQNQRALFEQLQLEADWRFVRVMRDAWYALERVRKFRLRAARRKCCVATSDDLDR